MLDFHKLRRTCEGRGERALCFYEELEKEGGPFNGETRISDVVDCAVEIELC